MRTGAAIADVGAGLFAALGILTALLEREYSGQGQWVQSRLLHVGHRAARLPGGALPDERRSAAAGRQRPSDQHADLGLQDRRRLHQRRRIGRQACGSACARRSARTELLARPEFEGQPTAREEPQGAQRRAERQRSAKSERANGSRSSTRRACPAGRSTRMDQVFADPQVQHIAGGGERAAPELGEIRLVNQAVEAVAHAGDDGGADARASASTPTRCCASSGWARRRSRICGRGA